MTVTMGRALPPCLVLSVFFSLPALGQVPPSLSSNRSLDSLEGNCSLSACQQLVIMLKSGELKPASDHELKDARTATCIGGYKENC